MNMRMPRVALVLCLLAGMAGCGVTQEATLVFPVPAQPPVDVWGTGRTAPAGAAEAAQAAAINPFDPIALNNLAVVEASRGRYQQALSLLQRAVKLAPARADIAANLGSLQRWLALAEGQAAIGMTPQPLQLPYQESALPPVPSLWVSPAPAAATPVRPGTSVPSSPALPRPSSGTGSASGRSTTPQGR